MNKESKDIKKLRKGNSTVNQNIEKCP